MLSAHYTHVHRESTVCSASYAASFRPLPAGLLHGLFRNEVEETYIGRDTRLSRAASQTRRREDDCPYPLKFYFIILHD